MERVLWSITDDHVRDILVDVYPNLSDPEIEVILEEIEGNFDIDGWVRQLESFIDETVEDHNLLGY